MERLSRADRICVVAAAAASDLNDELTVILNSVALALREIGPEHRAHPLLVELRAAAQRCAGKSSGLLRFSEGEGARASAASMEALVDHARGRISQ